MRNQPRDPPQNPPAAGGATLCIYLLGPPRAEWHGHPLAIPRRQLRALLYLLASRLQPIARDHLCFLFWPDIPETAAHRNLSRLLSQLRAILPAPQALIITQDRVALDLQLCRSDTATLQQRISEPGGEQRIETLREAIELSRGSFLEGFSLPGSAEFENWISREREYWQQLVLKGLAMLLEERALSGDHAAAIAYARRYLAIDDLAEDIHRRLIELYVLAGDRAAALRQFERCVAALERELGVRPLPETEAVYRAALEEQPFPAALPPARPPWATLPGLDVPLVGREQALRSLEQAYYQARQGQGRAVLIAGEAGIGKSRLMQEFAGHLQGKALLLTGAGSPDAQTMPYQLIVQALRAGLAIHPLPLNVPPVWLSEVSRLMPELRAPHVPPPPPAHGQAGDARAQLFEGLYRLLLGWVTGPQVVLMCLDDLHWADAVSLDWLAYLGRRLSALRLLVVGAYRSEESAAVAELRHSLSRANALLDLPLGGLDEDAVRRIVRHQMGAQWQSKGEMVGRLQHTTGGNPFFLLETLRVLIEKDVQTDRLAETGSLPLPDTVRQAVQARVGRLSARARQVLEAASVLGMSFDFAAVRLTSGRREMETMDSLDELVSRQLLLEETTGYRFHHDIVREAVYSSLSLWRRRLLHRRAAGALEKLRPTDAAVLSGHLERAGEYGPAARYALAAGQTAKAVFAHAQARADFERALALLEQESWSLQDAAALAENQRLRVQAFYERGWALRLLGDMQTYAHDLEEVARLAESLGDVQTLAHLRWREAYTHRWFCRYAQARAAADEGVRLSQACGDRALEAMCWREVGMIARETGEYEQARPALQRALDRFDELGDVVYQLHTLGNLSTLYWQMGDPQQAMALARRALARCDEAQLPRERRLPLGDMGVAAAALGDTALARQCLEDSLAISRQVADRTQEIFCLGHLGWLCLQEGQPLAGARHLQDALELAEKTDSRSEQSWLLCGLAEAQRLLGDSQGATAYASRALELAQACGRVGDQERARRVLLATKDTEGSCLPGAAFPTAKSTKNAKES